MSSKDTDPNAERESAEAKEKPKLTLEVKIDKPGACQRHVTVTVAREDVERYLTEAFDELKPKAEVPGFRPGRAPRKLVESRFRDQVNDQVKGSLLMDSLSQVSDEYEFSAISEPDFDLDAVSIPEDGPFTFEFDVEVRPEFEVPAWDGLQLERPIREYTDEDVERYLNRLLERYGKLVPRDGGAEPKDVLTVDIEVMHDGEVIAAHPDVRITLQPNLSLRDATINGIDKLLAGATHGDTRETQVTISEGAEHEAMRGQEVTVRFEIEEVRQVELPKLTPTFLDSIGGFEDEDELREAVRHEMERQAGFAQQQHMRKQITAALLRGADWELPPALVRRQVKRELERMVLELQSAGFSVEMIQKHANEIRQNSVRSTEVALKEHFILERIAEDREIDAEPADYDAEVMLIAEQTGDSARRVRSRLEKRGQMDALRNQIIERKVIELICSQAHFTDVPLPKTADDTCAVDLALAGGHDASEIPEAKHGGEAEELREPIDRP
ncbi:MAG: trigger factor [Planctomycetaceae bacterium]|nr:trigger factor [Planctomycetaceae bacterium]